MALTKLLKIFSGGAMRPLLREIIPLFERVHGVTAEVEFRLSSALKRAIEDGARFDVVILPRPELDVLIAGGAIIVVARRTWRARRSVSRFALARRSPISAVSRRCGVRSWPLARSP